MNFSNVGTLTNRGFYRWTFQMWELSQIEDFTDELFKCGNSHKLRILQMDFSNVGTLTN
ncbi:hypothetical protein [Leptospira kirschneri]|uniref:hypothetical protein n=1 Tax=Leptospira kirschneri TaxID=29507 RepID=UPI0035622EEB